MWCVVSLRCLRRCLLCLRCLPMYFGNGSVNFASFYFGADQTCLCPTGVSMKILFEGPQICIPGYKTVITSSAVKTEISNVKILSP